MKFIKIMMACSIFVIALTVISCQKVQYKSRDTSMLKPPPPDTTRAVIDTSAVLSNCDQLDGWGIVNGGTEITVAPKEGKGFVQGTVTVGGNFMQFQLALTTPVNTKQTKETGELKFWFYVQDVTQYVSGGQIQISSANNPDNYHLGWGLDGIMPTLHNGWNHLELRFVDAYGYNDANQIDLTKLNYMRIFWNVTKATAPQTYGIDDVRVDVAAPVMINNCDQLDNWNVVNGGQLLTKGQKEGTGFIQGTITAGGNFMQFQYSLPSPAFIDTKAHKDVGYLEFWWYIQDVTQYVSGGQIQISSANNPDDYHLGWGLDGIMPTMKNGWNHLKLKMTDAYGYNDAHQIDLTKLNYMRIFWNVTKATAPQTYGLDDIEIHVK
ncbi:MAG TPA: hypothetical protein VNW95_05570 [Mucilaginibacter sp.]|nr:hypothetical protein [Mucilaginibacter sp.]